MHCPYLFLKLILSLTKYKGLHIISSFIFAIYTAIIHNHDNVIQDKKTFEIIKNAEFVIEYGFQRKNLEINIKINKAIEKKTIIKPKYHINFNGNTEKEVTVSDASFNSFENSHLVSQRVLLGSLK